jgi:ABC-type amino acid transport substrate-binding protein
LYPLAYPFPHLGKLLGMLFIPFSAWFLGNAMAWEAYPAFLAAGLFSYFGGPLLATPYLLDLMHLPHDMFQLFVASGVYCGRLSDALGVMHLVTFTLLTTCAFTGWLRLRIWAVVRYLIVTTALGVALIVVLRTGLARSLKYVERKEDVIAQMQLLEQPVPSVVLRASGPNPDPRQPGESLLERIRRRGVLRVGFNADKLPFAYFNQQGELVGFDVAMAHDLARDLGVQLEFVPFDRSTLVSQLGDDHFDVVMSGLVGTLERAEAMLHTAPYLDVTLALVVPDYRVPGFASLDAMRRSAGLRIGFVDLSRGFLDRFRDALPNAELIELPTSRTFFEEPGRDLDALLTSAESGSAYTLFFPQYEVVVPEGPRIALPLFYAVGARDAELRRFLDYWVSLRKKDGTLQDHYEHWILGKRSVAATPRWCVIRDVLGWIE